jgi:hypothetical protein
MFMNDFDTRGIISVLNSYLKSGQKDAKLFSIAKKAIKDRQLIQTDINLTAQDISEFLKVISMLKIGDNQLFTSCSKTLVSRKLIKKLTLDNICDVVQSIAKSGIKCDVLLMKIKDLIVFSDDVRDFSAGQRRILIESFEIAGLDDQDLYQAINSSSLI